MAWPTSKYAGSMSPSSSALSSASRCRKSGTDPRSGARPGVPCIPPPSLHGPVCDEPVAEGLDVGLPPPLELPYGLDDLLVQPREPLGEGAGYPVRELEGRRAALRDHPSEGLARYLDARDLARRRHGRRGPALPEHAPPPPHAPPAAAPAAARGAEAPRSPSSPLSPTTVGSPAASISASSRSRPPASRFLTWTLPEVSTHRLPGPAPPPAAV